MGVTNLILIPVAYGDGDDELVPDELFDRYVYELSVKFGGCTFLPTSFGGWVDSGGTFQPDRHRPLFVDVPEGKEAELDEWIQRAGRELRQEVMLVLRNFCQAVFIEVEST